MISCGDMTGGGTCCADEELVAAWEVARRRGDEVVVPSFPSRGRNGDDGVRGVTERYDADNGVVTEER